MINRALLGLSLLTLTACPPKRPPIDTASPPVAPYVAPAAADRDQAAAAMRANFQRVSFAYDSAALGADSRSALTENAAILSRFGDISVEIQGHADERGSTDYNLALGQRRAHAVYSYLKAQGVDEDRLKIVSYGEERPLSSGEGEPVWAQNRRAEFRVLSGADRAQGTTAQ